MLFPTRTRVILALSCFALVPAPARAAGFAIFEQGARGMGFGGAFTAQSSDPSAIFHNAAGIAFLKGSQIYVGASGIVPKTDFTGANPFPGAGVTETGDTGLIVPPTAYYTQQVSEGLVFGVGLDVPFGLRTSWTNRDTTYSGRFISKLANLKGFALNPTLAYKLADRLAIGGGVDIRFSSLELDKNIGITQPFTLKTVDAAQAKLTSDTKTAVGFNVGILAKPTESFSIGASYRHKVKVDYTGSASFTLLPTGDAGLNALVARQIPGGAVAATTSIEFPAVFSGGLAYTWGDWTVEGDVDWYQWSTFVQLPITIQGRPDLSSVVPENYADSMQYRVGIERRLNTVWSVRGGYYYDKTPSPPASVSPLLPDADRNGIALGLSYKPGRFRVDVANLLVLTKDRSTEGVNRDHYDGTYKTTIDVFAVSIGYSF